MSNLNFQPFIDLFGWAALVGGAVLTLLSRLPKETIKNQADLITALNGRLDDYDRQREVDRQQILEYTRQVGVLQGQIEIYKSLPLERMATDMKAIADTNTQILNTLQASVITLARTEADKKKKTTTVSATLTT